jgi:hypothetical protein
MGKETPVETRSWAGVSTGRKASADARPNREFQTEKGRQSCERKLACCQVDGADVAEWPQLRLRVDCKEGNGSAPWGMTSIARWKTRTQRGQLTGNRTGRKPRTELETASAKRWKQRRAKRSQALATARGIPTTGNGGLEKRKRMSGK